MAEPKIADLQKAITALETRINTAVASIVKLDTRIKETEKYDGRIKAVDGGVSDAWSSIDDLKKAVSKKADK